MESQVRVDRGARIPLATQIAQQIRWLITGGQIPAGRLLPPVRSLAANLDINQHTVRAAYQQLARDGLVEARPGRGTVVLAYDPQRLAAATPHVPSFTVGVIIPNYTPFYRPFLDGIEDAAGDHPPILLIGSAREDRQRGLRYLDRLIARNVDGVIVAAPMLPDKEARSRHRAFPYMVFADWPGGPQPAVDFDLEAATFQGTRHLLDHGHTRIGLIAPPRSRPNLSPRYTGYEKALHAAGVEADPQLQAMSSDWEVPSGRAAADHLLPLAPPPPPLVTVGDVLAVGAFQAARRLGLSVPTDLAIVGGDGAPNLVLDPPLTTVALPARQMGIEAMHLLQKLITGRSPRPRRSTLQPELVVGRSCGCPR
jgi:LacI family transcriptional regulator